MKKTNPLKRILILQIGAATFILAIATVFLLSFTVKKMNDDLFKQLGIAKTEANAKITRSILGGYLNTDGVKNIKNIVLGNRSAIITELLMYIKNIYRHRSIY